jgi:pimeloyl-ACP methyl ester carboxylesterase
VLVDVGGGRRLHLDVIGEPAGGPTVVLETGLASMSANWAWVRRDLAASGRVVSYDRAGLGWSDPDDRPPDAARSADDLRTALRAARIDPPYVLAGHSYGGLVVRMFADRYPTDVVALVLVDASHPDQWTHIPASLGGRVIAATNRVNAGLARLGLLRLLRTEKPFIAGLPPREYAEMRAYLARPRAWSVGADVLTAWRRRTRRQVSDARALGDLPVVVLSVSEQDRYAAVLTALQVAQHTLSTNLQHATVTGATHYTLVSEQRYATVVVRAIRAAVRSAATGEPVAPLTAPHQLRPFQPDQP